MKWKFELLLRSNQAMNLKSYKTKKIVNFIIHRFLTAWQSFKVRKNNRLIPTKDITLAFLTFDNFVRSNEIIRTKWLHY